MIVIPAIDLKDGKVVRLLQGSFDKVTEYSSDPVTMAKLWVSKGAERLHIVDLDGAQTGIIKNLSIIIDISQAVDVPIQMGGGIRNIDDVIKLLTCGVSNVILSTKIVENRSFLKDILKQFGDRVIASLDCVNGKVTQHGWTDVTHYTAVDFGKELEQLGVQSIVYTDVARDGMLKGPNFEGIKNMLEAVNIPIIASGGISSIGDIQELLQYESQGLQGIITGKAIYEGKLILEDAIKLCVKNKKSMN